jgi:hypothetical protein
MGHARTWLVGAAGLVLASVLAGCPSQDVVLEEGKPDASLTRLQDSSMEQDAGAERDAGTNAARDPGENCTLVAGLLLVAGSPNCHVPNSPTLLGPLGEFFDTQRRAGAETDERTPCDGTASRYLAWDPRTLSWIVCEPYCGIAINWVAGHQGAVIKCFAPGGQR